AGHARVRAGVHRLPQHAREEGRRREAPRTASGRVDGHRMDINIIFVLGPSGVGKSDLSKALAEKLDYEFYEIDQWPKVDGIDAHGLRDEWDEFCRSANAERLADLLRGRADAA